MSEYDYTPMPSPFETLASVHERITSAGAAIDGEAAPPEQQYSDSDKPTKAEKTEWDKIRASIDKARETLRTKYGNPQKRPLLPSKKESDAQSADRSEDRKIRDKIIKDASDKARDKAGPSNSDLNTDEMRETRRALRSRYPGQNLGEVLKRFEEWEGKFRSDPMATREAIMAEYLKVSPQHFTTSKAKEYAPGTIGAVQKATEDARDIGELKPFIEKYGKDFPRLLQQLDRFDRDMIDDPVGTSARLAANYGAPVTASQHEQAAEHYHQKAQQEERLSNVHRGLEMVIQQNLLPGIEDDKMQGRIAEVLENPKFVRTGNAFEDLKAAWQVARLNDEKEKRVAKGQKSISGGPSGAASDRKGSDNDANTAVGAIRRAMGK